MPRGKRVVPEYTGKAAKIYEKVQKLESDLKAAKEELKVAYKEQLKAEKAAQKEQAKENEAAILKAAKASGKSVDEILAILNS